MRSRNLLIAIIVILSLIFFSWKWVSPADPENDWEEYLGGPDRNHYSALEQINTSNVHNLKLAWEYHTNDSGQIQCNPIIIDGVLYGLTAAAEPFALDATTGIEKWKKKINSNPSYNTGRGLTYWSDDNDKRILFTNGSWLYALDAATGNIISSFGDSGRVSLKAGLGKTAEDKWVVSNAPGVVFNDLIVMPLRVSEGSDAAPGYIQAFNIRTGRLAWVFRTIPHPGEPGYDTWPEDAYKNFDVGGANCWGGMAIDRQRGIVYVPTGSAAYDYYGAKRKGANLFANCLLALNASTGALLWYQQLVHHDIWDRDLPAPPNLVTITRNGQRIDAVAQITKQGFVFVFDRESGKPLYPVVEKNVPASVTPGEHSWPTQPMPLRPLPYMRQTLTEQDISPFAENKDELLATFRNARYKGSFTPLFGQSIVFPGLDGGAEWGGAAVDPEGVIYINSNEVPWLLNLKKRAVETPNSTLSAGNNIYNAQCASCHGKERKGSVASGFPSLLNLQGKRSREYLHNIIANGKGMMPAFTSLSKEQKETLVAFLLNQEKPTASRGLAKEPGLQTEAQRRQSAYYLSSVAKFLDSKGLPAITPPWGTLNAIDLNTGDYVWRIPFGEYPELVAKGIDNTGAESYGGPVVTASGLLFIAGTKDKKFRVYDKNSGKLLWQTILPAASFATPATYQVNGKQYIVLACGGSKLGAAPGDSYVAFALP